MGFVAVDKIFDGRTFDADDRGVRTYHQTWRVEVNDQLMGPLQIAAAPGIPRRYHYYDDGQGFIDEMALAMSLDARPQEEENPFFWLIDIDYSTRIWEEILRAIHSGGSGNVSSPHGTGGDQAGSNDPVNPLNQPYRKAWTTQRVMRPVRWDVFGAGIVNKASDLLDPLPELPERIPTLTIERNEPFFDDARFFGPPQRPDLGKPTSGLPPVEESVNVDVFFGYSPGFVLLSSMTAASEFANGFYFAKVVYVLEICPKKYTQDGKYDPSATYFDSRWPNATSAEVYCYRNGWNHRDGRFLNAGWNERKASNTVPIQLGDGQRPTKPWPLKDDGSALPKNFTYSDLTFLQYVLYEPRTFAFLKF